MNFDNQGIVSGTYLRQWWVLLLVDGAICLTEIYYKMHFYDYGIHHSPSRILELYKDKCLRGSWSLDFGEKGCKIFGLEGILLIRDGYFYIGRVKIITVFPWQFLVITQLIIITLNIKLFCFKNHRSSNWRCSLKEDVLKKFIKKRFQNRCFLVKLPKFLRTSIFKNICERLLLQGITEKTIHLFLSQN